MSLVDFGVHCMLILNRAKDDYSDIILYIELPVTRPSISFPGHTIRRSTVRDNDRTEMWRGSNSIFCLYLAILTYSQVCNRNKYTVDEQSASIALSHSI